MMASVVRGTVRDQGLIKDPRRPLRMLLVERSESNLIGLEYGP